MKRASHFYVAASPTRRIGFSPGAALRVWFQTISVPNRSACFRKRCLSTGACTRTTPLKAVPFFTQLVDAELDAVRALANEKNYPKNAVILTEGEMGDSLYMIQSGKVKVFIGDENGREIILKILSPGAFFGEMSMIDKQPRSASVRTI